LRQKHAKGAGYVGNSLREGVCAAKPFRDGKGIAGESARVTSASFELSSENGKAWRAVVMVWATSNKAFATLAQLHAN
jgi:hypothetical protein